MLLPKKYEIIFQKSISKMGRFQMSFLNVGDVIKVKTIIGQQLINIEKLDK